MTEQPTLPGFEPEPESHSPEDLTADELKLIDDFPIELRARAAALALAGRQAARDETEHLVRAVEDGAAKQQEDTVHGTIAAVLASLLHQKIVVAEVHIDPLAIDVVLAEATLGRRRVDVAGRPSYYAYGLVLKGEVEMPPEQAQPAPDAEVWA
jgi:hypothetical protein